MAAGFSVLYILGCNEGPSARYRVFNHIDSLRKQGIHAEWVWEIHPELADANYLRRFSIVVNFRGGWSDRMGAITELLRQLDIPTVYDIDDLVFDPSLVEGIDAYTKMDKPAQQDYRAGMASIERMMKASDYVTVSTPFLADYAQTFTGKRVWVVPFGVNDRQLEISRHVRGWADVGSAVPARFITFLSGTNTHERDFAEAVDALRRVLVEYDDVYLKLVGYLDVDKHLPGLAHKVIRLPFMPWKDLVIEAASAYINIAPFDPDSPFCQSKSDLKYVEPAISGVPTIASPISSFQASITSGSNGIIARSAQQWYEALKSLIDDTALRDRLGINARAHVHRERLPEHIGARLAEVYREAVRLHAEPGLAIPAPLAARARPEKGLRIDWVIPQPFEGSGGHRNIFRAIRYLSEFGHSCVVHVLPDNHRFSTGREIRDFITSEFFDLKAADVVHGVDHITETDVLVCTYWTTAYVVKDNAAKAPHHVYFLQDYEPMFFPMGVDYVRACETYRFGFYPVTSGPWPLHMLQEQWGVTEGMSFRFPIDRSIYHANQDLSPPSRAQRIAYFARPDMPRRCYPLGVAALEIVHQRRPDVEILFYGDHSQKFQNIPFPFTNVGMTPRIEDLGDLYRSVDLGLCFSTTNPSLVPFEMMACGIPVVDLDVNGNEVSYGGRGNCILAKPNPVDIADKILATLDDPAKMLELRSNGLSYASTFPTELEMARIIERGILESYDAAVSAVTAGSITNDPSAGVMATA